MKDSPNNSALQKRIQALKIDQDLKTEIFNRLDIGLHIYQLEDIEDDRTLRMVMANQATELFTGVKVSDVIGKTLDENFPDLREMGIPQLYAKVVRTGKTIDFGELYYEDQRVKKGWFAVKAFPLPNNYVGVSFTNVTKRKMMDEEIVSYQNRLRSMSFELIATEERERRKIATELHDGIGQSLAFSKISLNQLVNSGLTPEQLVEVNKIKDIITQTISATRSLTFEISPSILYELGLQEALESLFEDFQSNYDITIHYNPKKLLHILDERLRYTLFRAIREILLNFVKYAQTKTVIVTMVHNGDHFRIVIEDKGVGFDVSKINPSTGDCSGLGLFSIRERISHLGGQFEIESQLGQGSRFTLIMPSS